MCLSLLCRIDSNTFNQSSGTGIYLYETAYDGSNGNHIIKNNQFTSCPSYQIDRGNYNLTITSNTFETCSGTNIRMLQNAALMNFSHNTIKSNRTGSSGYYIGLLGNQTNSNFINNTENWITQNIQYEYHYYPQWYTETWTTKKGDCTDIAILTKELLRINKIRTTLVYADDTNGQQHDMLFSAYGYVNPLGTPIRKVWGEGIW